MPSITIHVWGEFALFTVPHFRADPYSYDVMTPSAAKGVLKSIYWKPEFEWEIDAIKVINPIRKETIRVKSLATKSDGFDANRTLQTMTLLRNVSYVVEARLVLNPLRADRPVATYYHEAIHRMTMGQQFRQLHFGRREYTANYELVVQREPSPICLTRDLGSMLFDLVPIDLGKAGETRHPDHFTPVFFKARLEDGVLRVPRELHDRHRDQVMRVRNNAHAPRHPDAT